MCVLSVLGCLFGLLTADGLYFVDLTTHVEDNHFTLSAEPIKLMRYQDLDEDNLDLSQEWRAALDAPLQHAISVLREMDSIRAERIAFVEKAFADAQAEGKVAEGETADDWQAVSDEPEHLASFVITLATHNIKGKVLQKFKNTLHFSLAPQPGFFMMGREGSPVRVLSFEKLDEATYTGLLRDLLLPADAHFKLPRDEAYIVDMYLRCSKVAGDIGQRYELTQSDKAYGILRKLERFEREEQLAVSYCYRNSGEAVQTRSGHLRMMRDLLDRYHHLQPDIEEGNASLEGLADLVARAPAEPRFLALLANQHALDGDREQAFRMLRRLEPLIMGDPVSARIYREIKAIREGRRRKLMGQTANFLPADDVSLSIVSPSRGDYVGGRVDVRFRLTGQRAPLLQADLRVNGQLVDAIRDKPHLLRFKPDGQRRHLELEVTAWFKDRTYARATLPVRYVYIAEEEIIQLISLRTVVTRGGNRFLTDLEQDQFSVFEGGHQRQIVRFQRDSAPLRIAILMDTSGSMTGEKIYQAQYAVNAFLSSLEDGDSASVYAFDHKVVRISEANRPMSQVRPMLFTMRPQLSTSLHDAVLIAQDELREQEGTQVIIVLSDGNDSTSKTDADRLKQALQRSNALVYSVILGDAYNGMDLIGAEFLDELSSLTGSITTRVTDLGRLEHVFARIYQELKSFYFIDYYSNQANFDLAAVKLKVKGSGKARFRQHLNEDDLARAWAEEILPATTPASAE